MDSGARFNANELRHLSTESGRALLQELAGAAVVYRERLRRGYSWHSTLRLVAESAGIDGIDARLSLASFFDRLERPALLVLSDVLAAARAERLI